MTDQGAAITDQGTPFTVQGTPVTSQGTPVSVQTAFGFQEPDGSFGERTSGQHLKQNQQVG
jgi:hypothetical protein